jgi:uncharacterized protein
MMAIRTQYQQGQFAWVDLTARDPDEARDFYHRLFGWQCVDLDPQGGPMAAQFELEGMSVAGLEAMDPALLDRRQPARWNSYINVDDLEAICEQATKLGGVLTVPPRQVRDAGRAAFLRDPTGAVVGLWQKDQHFGAAIHQDFHSFCWNELWTRDLQAARDFYGRLFGWEFAEYPSAMGPYYVIRNGEEESSGIMQIDDRWGEMPPGWMVYFAVKSVDLSVDRLRQLGGYVVIHPFDIEEGRLAVVADPQGAAFELVEMTAPQAESAGTPQPPDAAD